MSNQSNASDQGPRVLLFSSEDLELPMQGLHVSVPSVVVNDASVGHADLSECDIFQFFPLQHCFEYDGVHNAIGVPGGPTVLQMPSEYLTGNSPFVSPQFPMHSLPPASPNLESTAATTPGPTTPAISTVSLEEDTASRNIGGEVEESLHPFRRIVDRATIDSWIRICGGIDGKKKVYQCALGQCHDKSFEQKDMARKHVRMHLNIDKEYECITWAAKRHSNTQTKQYMCRICHKKYARKDFWHSHEKRCVNRRNIQPTRHPFDEGGPSSKDTNPGFGFVFDEGHLNWAPV
ncbi:hypothetical protein BU17DRAFT_61540 [Hysterangium stoloniferum]|nr:hypothetical protein BU17DRAFT_61540 [Hysterangium stoloniferum]